MRRIAKLERVFTRSLLFGWIGVAIFRFFCDDRRVEGIVLFSYLAVCIIAFISFQIIRIKMKKQRQKQEDQGFIDLQEEQEKQD